MKRRNFLKAIVLAIASPQVMGRAVVCQPVSPVVWIIPEPAKAFWLRTAPYTNWMSDDYVRAISEIYTKQGKE